MQFVFLFINKLLTFLFCPITSASPVSTRVIFVLASDLP